MNAEKWIFPLALCFLCVSSNNDQDHDKFCGDLCKTQRLMAPLGSSVLLPCSFTNIGFNWVSWARTPKVDLVHLTSTGRIKFLDPKSGRVKAFPNQGSTGNYSICIDELEESDLGCYRCNQEDACLQVELSIRTKMVSNELWLLIYICASVAAFLLFSVCSYLVYSKKNEMNLSNPADVSIDHNVGVTEGPSAPPEEPITPPVQELHQGSHTQGAYNSDLVYENDDQGPTHHNAPGAPYFVATQNTSGLYPNLNQFNFERAASEKSKQKFHRELMNRLRQASFRRHYYVNQRELNKQKARSTQAENHHRGARKETAKENFEYKNPIYNRDADQLN